MSIRSKIISTVLLVAIISLSFLIGITIPSMESLIFDFVTLSNELGITAGEDSNKLLKTEIHTQLGNLAKAKASIADEKMIRKQKHVEIVADYISTMYKNPNDYKEQNANYFDQPSTATYNAQLIYAPGFDPVLASQEYGLMANISELLVGFVENDPDVSGNYFASKSGLLITIDDSSEKKDVYDPKIRVWYKNAVASKKLIWTDVYDDIYDRGIMITCAAPIYGVENEFIGVVGFDATMLALNEEIIETTIGKTGYAFIVNELGDTIISPNIKKDDNGKIIRRNLEDMRDPSFKELTKKIMARESGITEIHLDGHQVYMAYYPMDVLPWSVVTVITVEEALMPAAVNKQNMIDLTDETINGIYNSITRIFVDIFLIVCGTIILVIVSSIVLGNVITHPLKILTEGVHKISDGDLDIVLKVTTKDEIGTLANSFNMMTTNLKHYIIDLTNVTAEKERIGAELTIATQIQASMLPCIFPAFPHKMEFDIFASMHPAKEVGGDFYDFFLIDEKHLAIVIADVSGKGVPAALFMVIAKILIKNHAQAGNSPAEVFTNTNRQLCENNEANMFVTGWMGVLELDTGKFIFVNAGHNPPLLKKSNGQFEYLKSRAGFVLAGMEDIRYKQNEIYLEPGDTLFLYTDGVTEATDADNNLYSEPRLQNTLNSCKKIEPEYLLSTITNDIQDFVKTAPQFDDITMLSIKINTINYTTEEDRSDIILENIKNISLEATIDNIQSAIGFVTTCLDEYGVSVKIKRQMGIIIDEICSNIVKFAYQGSTGKMTIACDYDTKRNCFQLIFMDKGRAYNPLEIADPDITLSAEERKIGGLGLFMVKNIADKVTYEYKNATNVLIIEKYTTD